MGLFTRSKKSETSAEPGHPPVSHGRPPASPIWDGSSMILAGTTGEDGALASIVFSGERQDHAAIRRVDLRGAIVWDHPLADRQVFRDSLYGRVEDRVIVANATGARALDLETGELCWELPHPARLHRTPKLVGGELLLAFADQTWYRLEPRDGSHRADGRVRSEDELRALEQNGTSVFDTADQEIRYGGREIAVWGDLDVTRSDVATGPRGPTIGKYPIDGWKPNEAVTLAAGKLAVLLKRTWGNDEQLAIGLFEPTSLEPLRLVQLGKAELRAVSTVDDLLVVRAEAGQTTHFVVDARQERVLGRFVEGAAAEVYSPGGQTIWTGAI